MNEWYLVCECGHELDQHDSGYVLLCRVGSCDCGGYEESEP